MIEDLDFSAPANVADFYRVASEQHLRINMVVSLDGNFAGPSGRSTDISGPLDLSVLLMLRLLSEVVLVGSKTAIGEKYRYTQVREELKTIAPHNPPFCLVSSTLDIPSEAPIFADPEHKPFIIAPTNNDVKWQENFERLSAVAQIHVADSPKLDGATIRTAVHSLGFKKIVCEGGPKLLQTLLTADVVDELNLTISPTIVGTTPEVGALGNALKRLTLAASAKGDDFLFTRYQFQSADN